MIHSNKESMPNTIKAIIMEAIITMMVLPPNSLGVGQDTL